MTAPRYPDRDYGALARIGIGTPQANPTVEPEVQSFLPDGVAMYALRLTSKADSPKDRLIEYFTGLPKQVEDYDTLKLDAFGVGCTASTYLMGLEQEARIMAGVEARLGCPVITAVGAILDAIAMLGIKKMAVVSPYPPALHQAGLDFWAGQGIEVTATGGVDIGREDTRGIYELNSEKAVAALEGFDLGGADALLLSGTGMPQVKAVPWAYRRYGVPVLSSNSALVWAMLKRLDLLDGVGNPNGYPLLTCLADR